MRLLSFIQWARPISNGLDGLSGLLYSNRPLTCLARAPVFMDIIWLVWAVRTTSVIEVDFKVFEAILFPLCPSFEMGRLIVQDFLSSVSRRWQFKVIIQKKLDSPKDNLSFFAHIYCYILQTAWAISVLEGISSPSDHMTSMVNSDIKEEALLWV